MHDAHKAALLEEFQNSVDRLSPDDQTALLAFMQIIKGEIPSDPRVILRLNRDAIRMQRQGYLVPVGLMPMLAGLALNIIDGVADLADRRVLMSYYWHAEDVQGAKVPDVLKRNGFVPA